MISADALSGSFNNGNLNWKSVTISDIVNVPWNGVVITSINEFSPTGESAPNLDGSK